MRVYTLKLGNGFRTLALTQKGKSAQVRDEEEKMTFIAARSLQQFDGLVGPSVMEFDGSANRRQPKFIENRVFRKTRRPNASSKCPRPK